MVWQYATGRFKATTAQIFNAPVSSSNLLSESDILGMLCVESIFRVNSIDELMKPATDEISDYSKQRVGDIEMSEAFKAMRDISRVWNKARHDTRIPLRGPLSPLPPQIPSASSIPFAVSHSRNLYLPLPDDVESPFEYNFKDVKDIYSSRHTVSIKGNMQDIVDDVLSGVEFTEFSQAEIREKSALLAKKLDSQTKQ
jgi:hypothetical protein